MMRQRALRVGDLVRIVRVPPTWDTPGYVVPGCTRRLFLRLIERRRALRVAEIDERGQAWVWCRRRGRDGRIAQLGITLDEGCWVRVVPRVRRSGAEGAGSET